MVKDQPTGCWTAEVFVQHQVNMSTRSSSLCVLYSLPAGDQTSQVHLLKGNQCVTDTIFVARTFYYQGQKMVKLVFK